MSNPVTTKEQEILNKLLKFINKTAKERYPIAFSKARLEISKDFMQVNYLFEQWKNKHVVGSSLEKL